jgi:hypothetical protein
LEPAITVSLISSSLNSVESFCSVTKIEFSDIAAAKYYSSLHNIHIFKIIAKQKISDQESSCECCSGKIHVGFTSKTVQTCISCPISVVVKYCTETVSPMCHRFISLFGLALKTKAL